MPLVLVTVGLAIVVVGAALYLNLGAGTSATETGADAQVATTTGLGQASTDDVISTEGEDQARPLSETESVAGRTGEATELALRIPDAAAEQTAPEAGPELETAGIDISPDALDSVGEAPESDLALQTSGTPAATPPRAEPAPALTVASADQPTPQGVLGTTAGAPAPTAQPAPAAQPETIGAAAPAESGDSVAIDDQPTFALTSGAAAAEVATNTLPALPAYSIDTTTQGNWIGTYGECAYILAAYNVSGPCELPILEEGSGGSVSCSTCSNYTGGAGQDLTDCRDLDLNGDAVDDVSYRVYAGQQVISNARVLENPDGSCGGGTNGIWFSSPVPTLRYEIVGAVGQHRMSVYLLSYDSHARTQDLQVFVGDGGNLGDDAASAVVGVGDHYNGLYEHFDVDVAAGEVITVVHTNTGGANAVVSGIFFDAGAPGCFNGKACHSGGLPDTTTRGEWVGTYGSQGHIIFNRTNGPASNLTGAAAQGTTLIGGFAGAVAVTAVTGVKTFLWTDEPCTGGGGCVNRADQGYAMGYTWQCDASGDPRALVNPGECDTDQKNCASAFTAVASTWDDAGERTPPSSGPDLWVDICVDLPGVWELSVYAMDYDSTVRRQKYHLYEQGTMIPLQGQAVADIGEYTGGEYVTYTLEGPFCATLRAEYYGGANAIISGIFIDPWTDGGFTCDGGPPDDCDPGDFCTYTPGGWGAPAHGSNPGHIRDTFWNDVYGTEGLTFESPSCELTLTFTGPEAVESYLPCGGQPISLADLPVDDPRIDANGDIIDPDCVVGRGRNRQSMGVFSQHMLAMRLNVDYSAPGVLLPGDHVGPTLGDLVIALGPFTGLTVNEFLAEATEALLCGETTVEGLGTFSISEFSDAAAAINENFDDCIDNNGFLECPDGPPPEPPPDTGCGIDVTKDVVTPSVDINGDGNAPDVLPGDEVEFVINVEASLAADDVIVTDVLPEFQIGATTYDTYLLDLNSIAFTPFKTVHVVNAGSPAAADFPSDEVANVLWDDANNTLEFWVGDMGAVSNRSITYSAQVNLLTPIGSSQENLVVAAGSTAQSANCAAFNSTNVWIVPGDCDCSPGNDVGTPGFWCNHVDQSKNNAFTEAVILNWLEDIGLASRWFDENEDASTVALATDIVCGGGGASAEENIEHHLLTLWFNVASFNVWTDLELNQLCLTVEPFPGGTDTSLTVAEVITAAEQALLDGDPDATLLFWKSIIDAINNAQPPTDVDSDGKNGLQNDPLGADPRYDGQPCDDDPEIPAAAYIP